MILPSDVAVIARPDGESLFLADWGAWREYDAVTGELRSTRHGTWWPGTLTNPDTIAPFGDKLLLASSENQQIQLWDPVQQKEVLLINDPGVDNAIGFADAIVAASYESKDVVSIDPANPDQRNVLAAGLAYPLGLATESGNLYVGDFLAGQILQVAADGAKLDPAETRRRGTARARRHGFDRRWPTVGGRIGCKSALHRRFGQRSDRARWLLNSAS